ncbi:MAG: hypothetical protein RI580_05440 [Halothece sp. Uz-M2-17]|nr:hypothetical protein [Halothece sp. Uz-M2-17]
MVYTFDIIGVTPITQFIQFQHQFSRKPNRSKTYLGSYDCSLDGLIQATKMIPHKPDWDWDEVLAEIINFWLQSEERIEHWKQELATVREESLLVGRVANSDSLRQEFESLWEP